jgi:hypothetical protein
MCWDTCIWLRDRLGFRSFQFLSFNHAVSFVFIKKKPAFDMDRYGGPLGIVRNASHNIPSPIMLHLRAQTYGLELTDWRARCWVVQICLPSLILGWWVCVVFPRQRVSDSRRKIPVDVALLFQAWPSTRKKLYYVKIAEPIYIVKASLMCFPLFS